MECLVYMGRILNYGGDWVTTWRPMPLGHREGFVQEVEGIVREKPRSEPLFHEKGKAGQGQWFVTG